MSDADPNARFWTAMTVVLAGVLGLTLIIGSMLVASMGTRADEVQHDSPAMMGRGADRKQPDTR